MVAVAQVADRLHHALAEGHPGAAIIGYLLVFGAIWWPWVNLTWFASAYDCDDVPYRAAVMVMIAGVLILAAGVPRAFGDRNFTVMTSGYVVMRLAQVTLWLRAAAGDIDRRRTALCYAAGVAACQVGWVLLLAVPHSAYLRGWLVLAAVAVLATTGFGPPALATGVVMAALMGAAVIRDACRPAGGDP
ncbi:MAG: low temperature requirement protein A [Acidimicrobiia bacterium]